MRTALEMTRFGLAPPVTDVEKAGGVVVVFVGDNDEEQDDNVDDVDGKDVFISQ